MRLSALPSQTSLSWSKHDQSPVIRSAQPLFTAEPDLFQALADPTRRGILEQLSAHGSSTATQLASQFDITRQAVTKHLNVLAGAGLASSEKVGREARYQAKLDGLDEINNWVAEVTNQWSQRAALLANSLKQPESAAGGHD